ncbi:hypothetical protein [Phytohabitans rumicis]
MTTRGGLFAALVDDAGLFPPMQLPMLAAMNRHRADGKAGEPVLTHRFLCPASAVSNLRDRLRPQEPWRLGLIVDVELSDLPHVLDAVAHDTRLELETVELRLPGKDRPAHAVDAARAPLGSTDASTYLELAPASPAVPDTLAACADRGFGAKIRCGGTTAAAFPTAAQLAGFLLAAVGLAVPFKATAGLHHAVRYQDPVTGFKHHGFLNLLVAVCHAVEGADPKEVEAALLIDDGPTLAARARGVPDHTATRARQLFVAYGSCSTSEPVDDLAGLGLLESRLA